MTDSLGHTTHYRYDARGNRTTVITPSGDETTFTYNLADQGEQTILPATGHTGGGHQTTVNSYVYVGGPVSATTHYNESGHLASQILFTYGAAGELFSRTGDTEPVIYTYDAAYRKVGITDGNNHTTQYVYDLANNVTQITYPGGETVRYYDLDQHGRPRAREDGNGDRTYYVYNGPGGALSSIQLPGETISITYDALWRRAKVTDATGTRLYAYDPQGTPVSVTTRYTGLPAKTIAYTYYPNGARHSMTTPGGVFLSTYDRAERLIALTNPENRLTTWSFRPDGRLARQTLGNGTSTTYEANALDQASRMTNLASAGSVLSDFTDFAYDGNGNNIAFSTNVVGSYTAYSGYRFDRRDQLLDETFSRSSGSYFYDFGYDAAGNPFWFKNETRTYNANNQLYDERSTYRFVYDGNGNPVTYEYDTLTFDAENRLTAYETLVSATYTADNLRAWKDGTGPAVYYLYDGDTLVCELNGSGTVTAVNTVGPTGLLSRKDTRGEVFYLFDPLGNVLQRRNLSGSLLSSDRYDAWGTLVEGGDDDDPYGFQGQSGYYTDHETGLVLCTHRYYDPAKGRWLTRDPIGFDGGINLYGYCGNDPVNEQDPSGYAVETVVDILSIGWSVVDLVRNPSWANAGFLAWDIGAAIVPFAPGSYVVKGGKLMSKVVRGKRAVKYADVIAKGFLKTGTIITGSYNDLRKATKGQKGIQVHHLLEQRFAKQLGMKEGDMMSIVLTDKEHQMFTQRWRDVIGYKTECAR